jgi:hypothetical protein
MKIPLVVEQLHSCECGRNYYTEPRPLTAEEREELLDRLIYLLTGPRTWALSAAGIESAFIISVGRVRVKEGRDKE